MAPICVLNGQIKTVDVFRYVDRTGVYESCAGNTCRDFFNRKFSMNHELVNILYDVFICDFKNII